MKDTLKECIKNKKTSYTPIWFMRQAGRYLPEFREIRKNNQDFIKLCLNPNLINEITLQPLKRFDLDAAIIFSDILMIPYGLGQKVEFKKGFGPILGEINLSERILSTPAPIEIINLRFLNLDRIPCLCFHTIAIFISLGVLVSPPIRIGIFGYSFLKLSFHFIVGISGAIIANFMNY